MLCGYLFHFKNFKPLFPFLIPCLGVIIYNWLTSFHTFFCLYHIPEAWMGSLGLAAVSGNPGPLGGCWRAGFGPIPTSQPDLDMREPDSCKPSPVWRKPDPVCWASFPWWSMHIIATNRPVIWSLRLLDRYTHTYDCWSYVVYLENGVIYAYFLTSLQTLYHAQYI